MKRTLSSLHWLVLVPIVFAIAALISAMGCDQSAVTETPISGLTSLGTDSNRNAPTNERTWIPYVETLVLRKSETSLMPRSFTGILAAKRTSEVAFRQTGRIVRLIAEQGDVVTRGQVLAELDKKPLEANLAILKAQRRVAEVRLSELEAGPRKPTIEAARQTMKEIEALRDLAQATYNRRMQLADSDAISKQDIDDARLQLTATEGKLEAQRQVVIELEEGTRQEQIEAQRAEVAQMDANIQSVMIELDECVLKAPFDAIVSKRIMDEGAVVSPGITVYRLVENRAPEAWIGIPPELIRTLKVGDTHPLTIAGRQTPAKLIAFLPELDPVSRTQTVIFDLAGDKKAEPASTANQRNQTTSEVLGQIVQFQILRSVDQDGYWIPMTALARGNRGLWCTYCVIPSSGEDDASYGTIERRDVEIIQIDSERVLVRGTVSDGDRIIVTGLQKLTSGQKVQYSKSPSAESARSTGDRPPSTPAESPGS